MTIPKYKYIGGHEILCDEHMLSATELAKRYGIVTVNDKPNGLLVCHLLNDYIYDSKIFMYEYYYPHAHGIMRVYPFALYDKVLNNFILKLNENTEYEYITKDTRKGIKKIKYKYKSTNKIIDTNMEEKINGNRNESMSTLR